MDLAFSAEEEQFRTEVREFLDANLTAELRAAGRLQTSVYSDHEASMRWQAILHRKGWAAPAWPVKYGGQPWSVAQHYIFSPEQAGRIQWSGRRARRQFESPPGTQPCSNRGVWRWRRR